MKKLLGMGLVTAGAIASGLLTDIKTANAFVVHNGWNYTMDAYNDSTPVREDGSGLFEIRGAAHTIIGDTVIFAINSNIDFEDGVDWEAADDGEVHFSDLLINFTGKSLDQANGELYGIRFAGNNDSAIANVGVYSDVMASSSASMNSGWQTLADYTDHVSGKNITPTHGELAHDDPYFEATQSTINAIDTGTKIGDIEYISDLAALGLDFEHFGNVGTETMAFSFDLGLFASEDVEAMFHFALECNNDIVAGSMDLAFGDESPENDGFTPVPTPAAILPTLLGLFGTAFRKRTPTDKA